jgi:hypothetical protein
MFSVIPSHPMLGRRPTDKALIFNEFTLCVVAVAPSEEHDPGPSPPTTSARQVIVERCEELLDDLVEERPCGGDLESGMSEGFPT